MVVNLNDYVPLVTIIGAAFAPTIAAVWTGTVVHRSLNRTEAKLEIVHFLVNSQLTQAVDRLSRASAEIVELKALLESRRT